MRTIKTVFFTICLVVLNVSSVFAFEDPEEPGMPGGSGPPGPIGDAPIDSHIVLLLIMAIVLGITIIYINKIKKASM